MSSLALSSLLLGGCWLSLDFSGYAPADLSAVADLAVSLDAAEPPDLAACVMDPRPFLSWSLSESAPVPQAYGPGGLFQSAAATLPVGRIFLLGGYEGGANASSKIYELRRSYDFMAAPLSWYPYGDLPYATFGAAAIALPDGTGLLVGGQAAGSVSWSADGGAYQASPDQPYGGPNRWLNAAIGPDGLPWVVGGFVDGPATASSEVARRLPDMAWEHSSGSYPPALLVPRYVPAAVHFEDSLVVLRGTTDSDAGTHVATTTAERLPPPGAAWEPFPELPGLPDIGEADAVVGPDGSLYVVLVGAYTSAQPEAQIFRFDACTRTWQDGPQIAGAPNGKAAVAQGLDGRIYVIGGYDRGLRIYGPRILTHSNGDDVGLWGGPFPPGATVTLYQGTPALAAKITQAVADASGNLPVDALQLKLSSLGGSVTALWVMDDQARYPLRVPLPIP